MELSTAGFIPIRRTVCCFRIWLLPAYLPARLAFLLACCLPARPHIHSTRLRRGRGCHLRGLFRSLPTQRRGRCLVLLAPLLVVKRSVCHVIHFFSSVAPAHAPPLPRPPLPRGYTRMSCHVRSDDRHISAAALLLLSLLLRIMYL